jgi:hypothetical protein
VEDDGPWPVDDVGGHLHSAVGGQAVHEHRVVGRRRHHLDVHHVALELLAAQLLLGLLPHRHPRVGVHRVGPGDGIDGAV